ncbi:MAG: sulfite exporter TauE/SafE family protein [Gemmatimonadota bacterium]
MVVGYGLAVLIGVVLGALGGGGAVLTVPVLLYGFGVGMKAAVPMSLAVVGTTSVYGVWRYHQRREVDFHSALVFGPAAMLGALGGTWAALRVSSRLQLVVFAVLLLTTAVMMLRGRKKAAVPGGRRSPVLLGIIGAGVGFLTGLVGVGGGFMYVPALTLMARLEMRRAVGTSLALIVLSCAAGLAGYAGRYDLDWGLIGIFTALALVGVALGTTVSARLPQATLRRAFAVLLLLMGAFVLARGEAQSVEHTMNTGIHDDAVSTLL